MDAKGKPMHLRPKPMPMRVKPKPPVPAFHAGQQEVKLPTKAEAVEMFVEAIVKGEHDDILDVVAKAILFRKTRLEAIEIEKEEERKKAPVPLNTQEVKKFRRPVKKQPQELAEPNDLYIHNAGVVIRVFPANVQEDRPELFRHKDVWYHRKSVVDQKFEVSLEPKYKGMHRITVKGLGPKMLLVEFDSPPLGSHWDRNNRDGKPNYMSYNVLNDYLATDKD